MQIGKFDIGFWRNKRKNIVWGPLFEITQIGSQEKNCGCHIITIGPIAITWLGNECLFAGRAKPARSSIRRR